MTKVKFDGENAGEAALDLKVARSEVAKGIVHKYVVMVRQNARRVRFLPDFPRLLNKNDAEFVGVGPVHNSFFCLSLSSFWVFTQKHIHYVQQLYI